MFVIPEEEYLCTMEHLSGIMHQRVCKEIIPMCESLIACVLLNWKIIRLIRMCERVLIVFSGKIWFTGLPPISHENQCLFG